MSAIPRERALDGTLSLLREGYEYIPNRCRRLGSDVFATRLGFQPVICMRGPAAGALFYDEERFERARAVPGRVVRTLFGKGGVQLLDGEVHRHRKHMLVSLTAEAADLAARAATVWRRRLAVWEATPSFVLLDEAGWVLCRAVCDWAGVPLSDSQITELTATLHALIDAPAAIGPRHRRGRVARRRADRWAGRLIEDVRRGDLSPAPDSALSVIAEHRDAAGRLLPTPVAAVELLNILRPTVAVDRYIVFAALALHRSPHLRERVAADGAGERERFVQEIRRHYPFFPFVGARVRASFDWNGLRFPEGRLVLFDLFGTDHDPTAWAHPATFDPDRFRSDEPGPYTFVPQGGGEADRHHRCPGEAITIALMRMAVEALTTRMTYEVPEQDLRIERGRIPAQPRSGLVLSNVRAL